MTHISPLLITIRTTEDGYYRWELHDGPDGAFSYSGCAPLLERCFEDILRAQWTLADHLTADPDPEAAFHPDPSPHLSPVAQVHPTAGTALPAQQDIPACSHPEASSALFYPRPSDLG
mgnify:CR=1 FL=1